MVNYGDDDDDDEEEEEEKEEEEKEEEILQREMNFLGLQQSTEGFNFI